MEVVSTHDGIEYVRHSHLDMSIGWNNELLFRFGQWVAGQDVYLDIQIARTERSEGETVNINFALTTAEVEHLHRELTDHLVQMKLWEG